jgi:hypothetical protein
MEMKRCSRCGQEVKKHIANCTSCGHWRFDEIKKERQAPITKVSQLLNGGTVERAPMGEPQDIDPLSMVNRKIDHLIGIETQKSNMFRAMSIFFLYSIYATLAFAIFVISAIRNDSTGGVWISWTIYAVFIAVLIRFTKQKIDS